MEAVQHLDPESLAQSATPIANQVTEAARIEAARRNFLDFCRFCIVKAPYYHVNWHHKVIAYYLQKWAHPNSGLDRLIVNVPVQHGKSEQTSRQLPGWIFGNWPDARIIGGSYSATLAKENSRDAKRVINSENYQKVFPHTKIPSKRVATDEKENRKNTATHWEIVGRRGAYKGVGAGQGVEGIPADYLIIDDPLSRTMAASQRERDGVDEWWQQSLRGRLSNIDKALIVMTRWHQDDLVGRLLERSAENEAVPDWKVVKIKGIKTGHDDNPWDPREIGEPLWPAHKSLEDLQAIKASSLESVWMSLYQQSPVPPGGSIVQRDWLVDNQWKALPVLDGKFFWSVDPKAGSTHENSSEAVIQLFFSPNTSEDLYLIDEHKGIWDQPDTIEAIENLYEGKYGDLWTQPARKYIENKGDGPGIVAHIKDKVPNWELVKPEKDKTQRLSDVASYIKNGHFHVPAKDRFGWVDSYIRQLVEFPGSVRDDRVDATSQMLKKFYLDQSGLKKSPAYNPDGSHYLEKFNV